MTAGTGNENEAKNKKVRRSNKYICNFLMQTSASVTVSPTNTKTLCLAGISLWDAFMVGDRESHVEIHLDIAPTCILKG